ncbi:DUF2913 domain-containing protein [Vibrio crassostreae]|jgi:hypothetical protein|uniref:DUF2913 domain-containing protein n=2 Tax=Vibrio TaxID=662 RepID=A0AA86X4U3_9VIBR|nr:MULTISPECIES: DUF2913 family protein [Vibrio]CAH7138364.1 conserved hypothetical protein [Vibrio chagasii]MDH5951643.1 DUF2913 family protein [Vibrio crassostreae]PML36906.1 hypothetical protein BCT81_18355 [Vibrio sp. 10N.261.52.A1]ROO49585.1 hypothetical protein EDB58_11560 [Vibrio crassostreae]TCN04927.1 hypothetical protein EDB35_12079 [Vibrio crassostreae]
MSKHSSHPLLKSTFENTLLHLYFKVSSYRGFVKEKQRNKIIIDFLKPKIKHARYQPIKKKLKTICLMKDKFGSIEKHLESILNQQLTIESKNDIDKLSLLLELFEKVGLETKLVEETPTQEVDVVYLDRINIDNCFDDNRLIAPISLFIHTNELNKFTQCLTEQLYFKFEQHQVNQELGNYHYQLHPI